jgi:hypothetical protein
MFLETFLCARNVWNLSLPLVGWRCGRKHEVNSAVRLSLPSIYLRVCLLFKMRERNVPHASINFISSVSVPRGDDLLISLTCLWPTTEDLASSASRWWGEDWGSSQCRALPTSRIEPGSSALDSLRTTGLPQRLVGMAQVTTFPAFMEHEVSTPFFFYYKITWLTLPWVNVIPTFEILFL